LFWYPAGATVGQWPCLAFSINPLRTSSPRLSI
jgi:hypothetical protein